MTRTAPAEAMLCPTCRVDLVMSDRQGIEIDYCPRCRGVWLDRGELDKIIERSAAVPAPQPGPSQAYGQAGGYGHPHSGYHQGGEGGEGGEHGRGGPWRQKRRKSFLEELFD